MAGHDTVTDGWHKSSTSADGGCVEVRIEAEQVYVRDTKNRRRILTFSHPEWLAFLEGVRLGEFELPES